MDPNAPNHVDWRATSHLLRWLWLIMIFAAGFATHLVLAHAIIPSLLATGHIPDGLREKVRKARGPLYITAIIILGTIAFWFAKATDGAHEMRNFWDRFWM